MSQFRPQLACDFDESKLKFPIVVMPKIDGVRGLKPGNALVGRSLKSFKNAFVANRYADSAFDGFDGELTLGELNSQSLCRDTTGFVNRKSPKPGKPTESDSLCWNVFDYIGEDALHLPYIERLRIAADKAAGIDPKLAKVVPFFVAYNLQQVLDFEDEGLSAGYEGVILRDPDGLHKSGRATVKGGTYLRVKRFVDFEGEIVEILEAMENQNVAKINELGRTERSTHQENMVPKGMAGTIRLRVLEDVVYRDEVVIPRGQIVDVGPGNLTHDERTEMWQNRDKYSGLIGKAKMFPKGVKDKPRFATFISVRVAEDMSD